MGCPTMPESLVPCCCGGRWAIRDAVVAASLDASAAARALPGPQCACVDGRVPVAVANCGGRITRLARRAEAGDVPIRQCLIRPCSIHAGACARVAGARVTDACCRSGCRPRWALLSLDRLLSPCRMPTMTRQRRAGHRRTARGRQPPSPTPLPALPCVWQRGRQAEAVPAVAAPVCGR
jgi:hypothetical protein